MDATLLAAIGRARKDPGYGFDTLRDDLAALPVDALPDLLAAAQDASFADVQPQLVAALGDWGWPGAYEAFAEWMGSDNAYVVLDAGCALDTAGGGGFGFWEQVAPGDQPSSERVFAAAQPLLAWWKQTGRAQAPDEETWRASLGRLPTRQERIYILVRSTGWAVLADGRVVEDDGPLPSGAGVHHCPGHVDVEGVGPVEVVFALDSDAEEPISAVMVESSQGWLDISGRPGERRPKHTLGDPPQRSFRYEVGPTGSVRAHQG